MEDKMYKESILVIGDLMIDKSWILSEIPCPTSQLHQSIIPQKRENPKAQAYKPGGAASTCLSLRILSETRNQKYSIIGMGIWNSHDDNIWYDMRVATSLNNEKKIKDNNERLFTLLQLKTQNPGESVTNIKFRMYSRSISDIPELFARFDQDPDYKPHFSNEAFTGLALPKGSIKAVVIMDYNKGTVTKELIQQAKKLSVISNDALWFIDSKAQDLPLLISDFNFYCLALNREEFGTLVAKMKGSDEPQYIPYGENRRNEILYSIKTALDNLENVRWLVVKLDKEGAYLIDIERYKNNQKVDNFYRCYRARPYQAAGISAGDFFIASLVLDALKANESISETPKSVTYLKKACSAASSWLKWSEEAYWKDVQRSKNSDVPTLLIQNELNNKIYDLFKNENANWKCKSSNFQKEINTIDKKYNYLKIIEEDDPTIDIAIAKGFLGGFISVDMKFRANVDKFVSKIKEYIGNENAGRPLNCLVVAKSGTGKSFFVREITKITNTKIVEINVSQCIKPDDLLEALGEIQNITEGIPLLFIDEVDSSFTSGLHAYQYLLSPLWDSSFRLHGNIRQLPKKFVSICVASNYKNVKEFRKDMKKEDTSKTRDFISRINGPDFDLVYAIEENINNKHILCKNVKEDEIKKRTNQVYITIAMILKCHKYTRKVQRDILEIAFRYNRFLPRTFEQFIASLPPPKDGILRLTDSFKKVLGNIDLLEINKDDINEIQKKGIVKILDSSKVELR